MAAPTLALGSDPVDHQVPASLVDDVRRARLRPVRRRRWVLAGLLAALVGAFAVHVLLGHFTFTIPDFFRILGGADLGVASHILRESKLPRALLALLVGVCFGVGGAVFQTTLRNPLASPDIVGITMGASAAAVWALLALGMRGTPVSVAAFVGAIGTAVLVRLVAGDTGGYRLVLVGVGVAAALMAAVHYLFSRAAVWDAQLALRWLAGSVSGARWPMVQVVVIGLLLLLPLVFWLHRSLRIGELGDDAAAALGVSKRRTEALMLVAVLLVALGVCAAGPVAFVAFMAGPVARGLNQGRTFVAGAGLVGAIVVLLADFVGSELIAGSNVPVGVVTGAIGAPFLLWLMARGSVGRRNA